MNRGELLAVGQVVKAFGISGELIVQPMTDLPARFKKLKDVFIGPDASSSRPASVERVKVEARGIRLKLKDVNDRNSAEALAGALIFIDEKHRIRVPPGHYFIHDVVGMTVADEEGAIIGTVRDVMRMPANDIYVIDRKNGTELLLPAVKEFILQMDVPQRRMTVRLIEGMLEGS